jgi:enoyl-CoA hydratase/carnithine racemase
MPAESAQPGNDAVLYDQDGHIVTITYNRPDRLNAVNGAMREGLNAGWARFRDDQDAWVAILTGTGRAFCAGADLVDSAGSVGTWPGTFWEIPTHNSFESGWEIFKPTIAAVNGPCVGYGLTAVSACDFVIASERATFSFPEVTIGVPTIVGAIRLPPKIGWQAAMELLLLGEPISAQRALEIGLVWKVVPHDALMDEAHALADRLCAAAPLAQRAIKEVAWRTRNMSFQEAVRFGETMRRVASLTEDVQEGRAAFREKRPPVWKGR